MLRKGSDAPDFPCCYFLVELREAPDASRAAVNKKSRPANRSSTAIRSDPEHPLESGASA